MKDVVRGRTGYQSNTKMDYSFVGYTRQEDPPESMQTEVNYSLALQRAIRLRSKELKHRGYLPEIGLMTPLAAVLTIQSVMVLFFESAW